MTTQGQRIRELAARRNVNLTQLADMSGIDRPSITKIAGDKIGLGKDRAQKIAEALDVDVSEVLLPKAEAVTLASVSRRLQSVEGETRWLREQMGTAFDALGLHLAPREALPPVAPREALPPAQSDGDRP